MKNYYGCKECPFIISGTKPWCETYDSCPAEDCERARYSFTGKAILTGIQEDELVFMDEVVNLITGERMGCFVYNDNNDIDYRDYFKPLLINGKVVSKDWDDHLRI